MSPDKMIRMANQIATFFRSQPGDAPEKIADHLRDFWNPGCGRNCRPISRKVARDLTNW